MRNAEELSQDAEIITKRLDKNSFMEETTVLGDLIIITVEVDITVLAASRKLIIASTFNLMMHLKRFTIFLNAIMQKIDVTKNSNLDTAQVFMVLLTLPKPQVSIHLDEKQAIVFR